MARTKIGNVEVAEDGKIYLDGKPSTRSEVDLRIMAAQAPARKARLEAQLARLAK
jgi:2-methylaconitate cis-trans-isomerase PrpF